MSEFSKTLTKIREDRGMTKMELSAKSGIDDSLISKYERGLRKPSLEFAVILANALETTTDELLGNIPLQ